MGTTLTGTTPQDTYDSLIKVTDNGPLSGTLKALSDGLGNDSTLSLSTTAASIAGTLAVAGAATFDTSTLVVDATNNRVGVGTSSPATTLAVNGITSVLGGSQLRVYRTDNAVYGSIEYIAGGVGFKFDDVNSDGYRFVQGANTAMAINTSGNVGIGTSAPTYKLQADITNATAYSSANTLAASPVFWVNNNSTTAGTAATIRLDGGALGGNAAATISSVHVGSGSSALTFGTRNANSDITERVRILAAGGLTFNGDTAQANALDDYEEGTWTMGVSFGGASVGVTTSANTGTYTKIGRQVTVNGWLVLTSKGSSTGTAKITGLPFTIAFSQSNYAGASLRLDNISFANQFQGYGGIGGTTIELEEITEAGVSTVLTNADFANNSNIMVSMTYFV